MNNSSQKKKTSPKRRKTNVKQNPKKLEARGHLSPCAQKYLTVLANPFARIENACVPDQNVLDSYKFSVRGTSTFDVGTNGVGFVTFAPKRFGNDFVGNNSPVFGSYPTYAGSTITANTGSPGVWSSNLTRFPYPKADFSAGGKKIRLVGAGLRIFYSGTELNRGGTIYAVRSPNNTSLNGVNSITAAGYSYTRILPVDRRKHTITWKPTDPDDFEYQEKANDNDQTVAGNYGNASGPICLGFLINGGTAGTSYTYETVSHYEVVGSTLLSTPSHSDANGMSAIFSALPTVAETISSVMLNDTWRGAYKALTEMSGVYFAASGSPIAPLLPSVVEL